MKITKINFKNFMGYKQLKIPENNEDLPNGLILISGKNSYGKSTILHGILFAFFGSKIFKERNAESFITYGEKKSELYIYFTLDNFCYYIYRKWGRSGSGSSKLFQMDKAGVYREYKDFNAEDFFEISKEQALSTVFVRQGEVEELANKKGAELREMIIELFRLNIVDDALEFLDKEYKQLKIEKSRLEEIKVPISRIEEEIERLKFQNEELHKIISDNENKVQDFKKKIENYPSKELISKFEDLYNEREINVEKFNSYKKDFENKIKKTDFNIEDFSTLEKIETRLNALNKNKKEFDKKNKEGKNKKEATIKGIGKTKGKIDELNNKIYKMQNSLKFTVTNDKGEIALCPTCQSELTKDHYENIIQNFEAELKQNQEKVIRIEQLIKNLESELINYQSNLDRINKEMILIQNLQNDFENYQKYKLQLDQVQTELTALCKEYKNKFKDLNLPNLKKIYLEIERSISELNSIEIYIEEKQVLIKMNQKRAEELVQEIEKMKQIEIKMKEIEINMEHFNKAKEFVRRFVSEYMVVKRLVKNITLATNKYIKDFTSNQYSDLIIDLSGTKKTGLSLRIKDNFNGELEPIEILSGGDRTALGMALRLAISELMGKIRPTKESPKKNPKIDFLLLDEPLAALDDTRRERILKHLIRSKSFSQIFLITHTTISPDIQTHKIIVNKDHSTGLSSARFERQITMLL